MSPITKNSTTDDSSNDSSFSPSRRWIVATKIECLKRRVVTLEKVLSQVLDILVLEDSKRVEKIAELKKMLYMGFDERNGGVRK